MDILQLTALGLWVHKIQMGLCKGCRQPIKWIKAPLGNWMACDSYGQYTPKSGGIVVTEKGETIPADKLRGLTTAYRPHWDSCSAVKGFRRDK